MSKSTKPFHACITELLDNAMDARTDPQWSGDEVLEIVIAIEDKHGGSVRIRDNARGMNASQLQNAFRLGSSDKFGKNGMKGMYGFGLKTSATAIGPAVEVTSQPETGFEKYAVLYNPAMIEGWTILLKTMSAVPGEHGTEVFIPKRKMLVTKVVLEKLIHEIGTCYHDELESGQVKITVYYGAKVFKCVAIDHKWMPGCPFRDKITVGGHDVDFIVGAVDKPRSVKESNNGFEIIVGGRKIESGYRPYDTDSKSRIRAGLTDHPKDAKVYGRIYVNPGVLEVNTDKTGIIRNDNFWELNKKLANHPQLFAAQKLSRQKSEDDTREHNTPDAETQRDITKNLNTIVKMPKNNAATGSIPVEKRDAGNGDGAHTKSNAESRERHPKRMHLATRKIRGRAGKFDLRYADFPDYEACLTSYSEETAEGVIALTINTGHKNFLAHGDPYLYAYEEAALALMAANITEFGVDTAFEKRGELLDKFLSLTKEEYSDEVDPEVPADNPDIL